MVKLTFCETIKIENDDDCFLYLESGTKRRTMMEGEVLASKDGYSA